LTSNSHFYEKAIRDIYDAIAQEQSVRTLNTQYPATIQGKTSVHAADIYWEFTDGDIIYKTVIQAKETVTLGELFSLVRIIRDIPGQTTGVLITQPVYKKDIKEMAANAGIILYELLEPSGQDLWEPVVDNIQINVDKEWVKKEKERVGLGDEQVQISANPKYSFIYDENRQLSRFGSRYFCTAIAGSTGQPVRKDVLSSTSFPCRLFCRHITS